MESVLYGVDQQIAIAMGEQLAQINLPVKKNHKINDSKILCFYVMKKNKILVTDNQNYHRYLNLMPQS